MQSRIHPRIRLEYYTYAYSIHTLHTVYRYVMSKFSTPLPLIYTLCLSLWMSVHISSILSFPFPSKNHICTNICKLHQFSNYVQIHIRMSMYWIFSPVLWFKSVSVASIEWLMRIMTDICTSNNALLITSVEPRFNRIIILNVIINISHALHRGHELISTFQIVIV